MKILVVDDEDLVVEFLSRSLKLDRYIVDTAKDGIEAYKKATENIYDLIVLDVILPAENGIEVCERLRKHSVHTPILMLTSRAEETARVEGLNAGADDYLVKPFGYRELEARIRALVRRPCKISQDTITIGNLTLNSVKKTVSYANKPLTLRPKEYSLLEYLMRRQGETISKKELLDSVWSISTTNASNRLEVCMYHIRGKVNKKEEAILKTVRGYGYVIGPREG